MLRPELIGLYVRQRVLNVKQKIVAVRACVRACVAAVCVCFVCVCCCVWWGAGMSFHVCVCVRFMTCDRVTWTGLD